MFIALLPVRITKLCDLTHQGHNHFNDAKGLQRLAFDLLNSIDLSLFSNTFNKIKSKQALEIANFYKKRLVFSPISLT